MIINDHAVFPFPNKIQKAAMANYAIDMAHSLGVYISIIALIGASGMFSPHFSNSVVYKSMCEMEQSEEIKNCIMDESLDLFLT